VNDALSNYRRYDSPNLAAQGFPSAVTVTAGSVSGYTLTYSAGAGGTISGLSPQTVAAGGSGTPVTAVPNSGYHFVSWSDGVHTATRTDTNVTADKSVIASFGADSPNGTYLSVGSPYVAAETSMTVTLNSLTVTDKGGYFEVTLSYTEMNNTASKAIDQGQFGLALSDGSFKPQYGFFNTLYPGQTATRSYYWDLLKTEGRPVYVGYPADFFAGPANASLKWAVTYSYTGPDVTAPSTTSDVLADYAGSALITLTGADDWGGSGVARTYYTLDGGVQTQGSTVSVSAVGSHTLEFWSVDVAGNIETPHKTAAFSITAPPVLDTTPPTTTSDAALSYMGAATIHLSATDNAGGSGVERTYYRLDGGALSMVLPPSPSPSLSATTVGSHTIEFWSEDRAGNAEVRHVVSFTISMPKPAALPKATMYTPVAPSSVTHSHAFTVYGYVAPRHTSGTYLATLKFYLRNSHGVYVFHNSVNAKRYYYSTTKSKYSARVSLPHAGRWRVRAMHGDAGHSTSYSGYDYITVK